MKLPNGERAIADIAKFRDYCLNPHHPRGRNKARVFASLGITQSDAELLRSAVLAAAVNADAALSLANEDGQRYNVDFDLTHNGRTTGIRSSWIVRIGEDFPRLSTCYVI